MSTSPPDSEPSRGRALSRSVLIGLSLLIAAYIVSVFHVLKIRRETGQADAGDRKVIRLVHYLSEENVQEAFNALARRYEALHPDVKVIIQSVPKRAYQQWLNTQQIGGTTPDLFQLELRGNWTMASKFQEVLTAHVSRPNPYNAGTPLESVPWRDTYIDGMEGGYFYSLLEFYGVPMTVETGRIFYNKDLFEAATGSDAAPRDFGEWMAICAAIKRYAEEKEEKVFPIAATMEDVRMSGFVQQFVNALTAGALQPFDVNAGGGPTSQGLLWALQTGGLSLTHERLRTAFALLRELSANFQPGFASDTADQARFLFVQGRAAMTMGKTYDMILFKETARFRVGVFRTPFPAPDDPNYGRYVMGPVWEEPIARFLFGLSKESPSREAALDFMKFCTSLKNNEWFCRRLNWYPAIRGARTSEELEIFAPNGKGVWGIDLYTGPDLELYFDQNYLLFLDGQLSFDEFMRPFEELWVTKGEEWLLVKRDAISKKEIVSSERNLARSRVKLLFAEAGEMAPGQAMGTGTPYQLGAQIILGFFGHVFTYRQYIHPHLKNGTYQFPPHSLMPAELFPVLPREDVLESMRAKSM